MNASPPRTGTNTVVLVLSHVIDPGIARLFRKIWDDCHGRFSVRYLCDNTRGKFGRFTSDPRYTLFTVDRLMALGYPGKQRLHYSEPEGKRGGYHKARNFVMGNAELALLAFYRDNPGFDFYWLVEYDVRYTGSWRVFFSHFGSSQTDLLGTSLMKRVDCPDWSWWKSLNIGEREIGPDGYLRGFFPIYRLSNRALRQLDSDYRTGVSGHYECLIPTLLHHAGLSIEDIGGDGSFVRPENINRFYQNNRASHSLAPGTFVFMPGLDRPGKQPDTLWHPVKYRPLWRILASRIKKNLLGRGPRNKTQKAEGK